MKLVRDIEQKTTQIYGLNPTGMYLYLRS